MVLNMLFRKFSLAAFLFFILLTVLATRAAAVLEFKEVSATSAAIDAIYLENQAGFVLPPGTEGQLVAKTSPADLKVKVRWTIIGQKGDLSLELNQDSGRLTVLENSSDGWIIVQASADGCRPAEQRIDIDCPCSGESGMCKVIAGSGGAANSSVDVRISLGQVSEGRSAGDLFLYAEEPLAILSAPEALVVNSSSEEVRALYREDVIEQILTPQVIVTFARYSPLKYEIYFYDIAHRGLKLEDGLYSIEPTALPLAVWRIENPDPSGASHDQLTVTEMRGGEKREFYYSYDASENNWALVSGNGLKIEAKSETTNDVGERVVRTVIAGSDGIPVRVEETVYRTFAFGEKRIRETIDPDKSKLVTQYRYRTDPGAGYGKLAARIDSDGSWVRYAYDADGRKMREVRPFLDAGIDATESQTIVITTSYLPVDKADSRAKRDAHRPRLVIETTGGIETARTYYVYQREKDGSRREITERCTVQGAAYGHPTNLRMVDTYFSHEGDGPAAGKIKSRLSEDGPLTTFTYERGQFQLAPDPGRSRFIPGEGKAQRTTLTHGTTAHPEGIAFQTTRETTITDWMGREKMQARFVRTQEGYARIDWQFNTHDRLGRVVETLHANGTRTESAWGCCGKMSETDIDGITTRYTYDALKRMVAKANEATGIVSEFTYDAAGRRLSSTQKKDDLSLTRKSRYDSAGRLAAQVDAAGLVTRYATDSNVSTTTLPGGASEITTRYLDGRIRSIAGTAVVQRYYEYGIDNNGSQWTKVFIGKKHSPRWEKTTRDLVGRVIRVEKPGFEGIETARNIYDRKERLIRAETPGRTATLYAYDALGNLTRSGLDVDGDGRLTAASMDRITATRTSYKNIAGVWWQETTQSLFAHDNSAKETVVSIQRQRLTGWKDRIISEAVSIDIQGNETRSVVTLDRFNRTRTMTVYAPDSIRPSESVYVDGRLAASTGKSGITLAYGYNALGRRVAVEDPRKGVSTMHYDTNGRLAHMQDAAGNRTRYAYSKETGRKIAEFNAHNKATRYAYNARGQLIRTWGDVPYPVEYGYDDWGQMTLMHTFRGGAGWNDEHWPTETGRADPTRWHYQPSTGLLLSKEDAQGNQTSYTYGANGALIVRTWARLENGRPLQTSYQYDPATAALLRIDYSDDTPGIAFAYDRLGRKVRVNDAAGMHSFAYNERLQLEIEGLTGQQIYQIKRRYDELGRVKGFTLDDAYGVSYRYDKRGRFDKIDWRIGDQTGDVAYSYLENTDRLAGMASTSGLSVRYDYEPHRDLRTAVTNTFKERLISRYEYQYDRLGRRINVKNSGEAFEKQGFWLYGYNDRHEVTTAGHFEGLDLKDQTKPVRDNERAYQYDPIGNRTQTIAAASPISYTANELNQYTAVNSFSPAFDSDGNMTGAPDGMAYTYNAENRLIVAQPQTPIEGDTRVKFVYDYMGRRVMKAVYTNSSGSWILASEFLYVYDGWNLVKKIITPKGRAASDKNYVWGLDLSQTLHGAGGVGGLLAAVEGSLTYHYTCDANGNVGQVVDGGSGSVAAYYEYDPFGNVVLASGSIADENVFRFSTKYLEIETSLYYYGYRHYSAEFGRWINRDPIGENGGVNLYVFINNSPIANLDYLGLTDDYHTGIRDGKFYSYKCDGRRCYEVSDKEYKDWLHYQNNESEEALHQKRAEFLAELTKRRDWKTHDRTKPWGFIEAHKALHNKYADNYLTGIRGDVKRGCGYWRCVGYCELYVFIGAKKAQIIQEGLKYALKKATKTATKKVLSTVIPLYAVASTTTTISEGALCFLGCSYNENHTGYLPKWLPF